MFAIEFGKQLRLLREERGLSQRDLADRLQAYPPQISRYENGSQLPNLETLVTLTEILQVGLSELVFGRKSDAPSQESPIKDVRLLERLRELEKLDRQARETAIAMLEAIIVQGHQRALNQRLAITAP